jgi:hypothetical protein
MNELYEAPHRTSPYLNDADQRTASAATQPSGATLPENAAKFRSSKAPKEVTMFINRASHANLK